MKMMGLTLIFVLKTMETVCRQRSIEELFTEIQQQFSADLLRDNEAQISAQEMEFQVTAMIGEGCPNAQGY
jgi:type II secretory ATPase GspE/PulE/Tfp pilus assembly ATPase PilB-like protein